MRRVSRCPLSFCCPACVSECKMVSAICVGTDQRFCYNRGFFLIIFSMFLFVCLFFCSSRSRVPLWIWTKGKRPRVRGKEGGLQLSAFQARDWVPIRENPPRLSLRESALPWPAVGWAAVPQKPWGDTRSWGPAWDSCRHGLVGMLAGSVCGRRRLRGHFISSPCAQFTDNGQIIFPASDSSIPAYPNPPPGGFNGHEEVPMIAVFWDNADFSRGTGTTFYQVGEAILVRDRVKHL